MQIFRRNVGMEHPHNCMYKRRNTSMLESRPAARRANGHKNYWKNAGSGVNDWDLHRLLRLAVAETVVAVVVNAESAAKSQSTEGREDLACNIGNRARGQTECGRMIRQFGD